MIDYCLDVIKKDEARILLVDEIGNLLLIDNEVIELDRKDFTVVIRALREKIRKRRCPSQRYETWELLTTPKHLREEKKEKLLEMRNKRH